jgi:DNA-nicking Smr family endonuclease
MAGNGRREEENGDEVPESVVLPIDGILDLHAFRPGDVKDLLEEYIAACRRRGILQIRIIHGKGTGELRRAVRTYLKRIPGVAGVKTASELEGGWGATIVLLS